MPPTGGLGHGRGPAGDAADRPVHPGDVAVPDGPRVLVNRPRPARRPHRPARHPSAGTPGAAASGPAARGDDRRGRRPYGGDGRRARCGLSGRPDRGGGGAGAGRGLLRLLAARPGAQPGAAAGRELPERAGRPGPAVPPGVPARRRDDRALRGGRRAAAGPVGPGRAPAGLVGVAGLRRGHRRGRRLDLDGLRPLGGRPLRAAGGAGRPVLAAPGAHRHLVGGGGRRAALPGGDPRRAAWPGPPSGRAGGGGGAGGRHGGDVGRRGAPRAGPGPVAADPADRAVRLAAARRRRRPPGPPPGQPR